MRKEFAFEVLDVYGNRAYWAASYPNRSLCVSAAKEYISNRIGQSANIMENENFRGDYRSPRWVHVCRLVHCYQCMRPDVLFYDSRCKECTRIAA